MTSAEEFAKVYDYFNDLAPWIWHDFRKVPEEIAQKVFEYIESGIFLDQYHLGWSHTQDNFFIKTKIPKV